MTQRKSQSGSAHVIIIAVLVVALVGALGWIFWQNFVGEKPVPASSNDDKNITQAPQQSTSCVDTVNLCFKVPSSWTSEKTETTYPGEGSQAWIDNGNKAMYTFHGLKLNSGDKSVTVHVGTGIGQIGGICGQPDQEFITVQSRRTQVSAPSREDNTDTSVYAVSGLVQKQDNSYIPIVMLTNSQMLRKVGVYNICYAGYGDIFPQNEPVADGLKNIRVSTTREILNSLPDPSETGMTKDEATALLKGTDYTQAFSVVASAYYQE